MNDLNFFSPYMEHKRVKLPPHAYILLTIPFLLLGMSIFYYWVHIQMKEYNNQIKASNEYLSLTTTIEKINELKELKEKTEVLNKYYEAIQYINAEIADGDHISSSVLARFCSTFPQNLFIKSLSFDKTGIQIEGVSNTRIAIAEFEYNLKMLNIFKTVHVASINAESEVADTYTFSMKCSH